MSTPATLADTPPAEPSELDRLLCAISEAIEALVQWNIPAFQAAVDRQSAICEAPRPERKNGGSSPGTAATARRVQDLNRVYDRLLQHSIHWTRTIHATFRALAATHIPAAPPCISEANHVRTHR